MILLNEFYSDNSELFREIEELEHAFKMDVVINLECKHYKYEVDVSFNGCEGERKSFNHLQDIQNFIYLQICLNVETKDIKAKFINIVYKGLQTFLSLKEVLEDVFIGHEDVIHEDNSLTIHREKKDEIVRKNILLYLWLCSNFGKEVEHSEECFTFYGNFFEYETKDILRTFFDNIIVEDV